MKLMLLTFLSPLKVNFASDFSVVVRGAEVRIIEYPFFFSVHNALPDKLAKDKRGLRLNKVVFCRFSF